MNKATDQSCLHIRCPVSLQVSRRRSQILSLQSPVLKPMLDFEISETPKKTTPENPKPPNLTVTQTNMELRGCRFTTTTPKFHARFEDGKIIIVLTMRPKWPKLLLLH